MIENQTWTIENIKEIEGSLVIPKALQSLIVVQAKESHYINDAAPKMRCPKAIPQARTT
jgi:hypothetical protein